MPLRGALYYCNGKYGGVLRVPPRTIGSSGREPSVRLLWLNHRDADHPRAGGAERSIREITTRLARSGVDVTLVAGAWPGARSDEVREGVRIVRRGTWIGPQLAAAELRRGYRPDVVVDDLAHAVPWGSARLSDAAVIANFRHLHRRTLSGQVAAAPAAALTYLERGYPWLYRDAQWVTESSTSVRDLEQLGVRSERIVQIPPGVDLERFRPGERLDDPTFVYFAGLRPYKRADHAVRLVDELRRRGRFVRLEILGDGPTFSTLRALVMERGLGDRVRFHGTVSDAALAEIVSGAWISLALAVAEGWGLTSLEAAACGVPTLGYEVPGLRDSVDAGVSGELVPSGDLSALADRAESMFREIDRYRLPARAHAEGYRWDVTATSWRSLAERLAAGSA